MPEQTHRPSPDGKEAANIYELDEMSTFWVYATASYSLGMGAILIKACLLGRR
jgi:hypothetical protein